MDGGLLADDKKDQEEVKEESQESVKASKPTLFIILSIVNMLVVIGVGVLLYLGRQKEASQPTIEQVVQGEAEALKEKGKEKEEEEIKTQIIPLGTFIVNLSGSRGRKVIKVNMEFELQGKKILDEVDKRKAQIRDTVIILLSSKTYAEVSQTEGKNYLRDEIKDVVNAFLNQGQITKVYFTDFVYN